MTVIKTEMMYLIIPPKQRKAIRLGPIKSVSGLKEYNKRVRFREKFKTFHFVLFWFSLHGNVRLKGK